MKQPIPFISRADQENVASWIAALQQAMPDERIVSLDALDDDARLQCTVAIVANPDPSELKRLPQLRWIQSVWAGVERMVEEIGQTDIKIVRMVDPQLGLTMAEAVLAWTLYLHRDMPAYAAQQKQQQWQALPYRRPDEKTVSLLGLGALGEAAAKVLLAAGFKVCGWSRNRKSLMNVECFAGAEELPAMLAKTDILVCLLPLTPDTHGLLNAATLACLKHDAELINFARAPIIDDAALHDALDSGRVKHAVLDVFLEEPLPRDRWHWTHPRVTVLPHCSAATDRGTASAIVARHIAGYRSDGTIPAHVDMARGY